MRPGEAGAAVKYKWQTNNCSDYVEEHILRFVAVETSGFVMPPALAAFRELASEQARFEMKLSDRGVTSLCKFG